jgi:hypothetical protein
MRFDRLIGDPNVVNKAGHQKSESTQTGTDEVFVVFYRVTISSIGSES